jgi:NADPH:quinone reductase
MKAVGYKKPLPITEPDSLSDIEVPVPKAEGRDLLVEVKAVSVNPVDVKVRASTGPTDTHTKSSAGMPRVVKATGSRCEILKAGDEVCYAGSIVHQGTNAEFHLVDERIVGTKRQESRFCARRSLAAYNHHRMGSALRQVWRA